MSTVSIFENIIMCCPVSDNSALAHKKEPEPGDVVTGTVGGGLTR